MKRNQLNAQSREGQPAWDTVIHAQTWLLRESRCPPEWKCPPSEEKLIWCPAWSLQVQAAGQIQSPDAALEVHRLWQESFSDAPYTV